MIKNIKFWIEENTELVVLSVFVAFLCVFIAFAIGGMQASQAAKAECLSLGYTSHEMSNNGPYCIKLGEHGQEVYKLPTE